MTVPRYGRPAQPLLDGVVCDECNVNAVLPHRLRGGAKTQGTATRDAAVSKLESAAEAYLSASVPSIPTLERLHRTSSRSTATHTPSRAAHFRRTTSSL